MGKNNLVYLIFFIIITNSANALLTDHILAYISFEDSNASSILGGLTPSKIGLNVQHQNKSNSLNCKLGNCESFVGSGPETVIEYSYSQRVNIGESNGHWTVCMWVYVKGPYAGLWTQIIQRTNSNLLNPDIHLSPKDNFIYQGVHGSTSNYYDIQGNLFPFNYWNFVCSIRDTNIHSLYLNNQLINSISGDVGDETNYGALRLGNNYVYGAPLNGYIDDIAWWNRSLTYEELTILWNNGVGISLYNDSSSYMTELESIKDRLNKLEERLNTTENRISLLESWKQTISLTIDSIKSWLGFGNYGTFCSAVSSCGPVACSKDSDCGTNAYNGDLYCFNDNSYRNYVNWTCNNPGTSQSSCTQEATPILQQNCSDGCQNGICKINSNQSVVFRTNVAATKYYSCTLSSNCWVALDIDGQNGLEALGFDSKASTCKTTGINVVGKTPEGYNIYTYGSDGKIAICDSAKHETRFYLGRVPKNAVTSTSPTEPYASSNQEVYGSASGFNTLSVTADIGSEVVN